MPDRVISQRLDEIEGKVETTADTVRATSAAASEERVEIASHLTSKEDLMDAMAVAAEVARAAAEAVRQESEAFAQRVETRLGHHDQVLTRLESAVGDVNGSVRNLLESVMVLQRNSMRVLGGGALLAGTVIYVGAHALGLG